MKIAFLAALLAALSLPISASAQVAQPAPAQMQRGSGPAVYHHWMKRLSTLNLSVQQQQQVQNVLGQYASQHPVGSAPDPQGRHALRDQIYSILSPAQQAQLHAEMQAQRARHMQRMEEQQQQQPVQPANPPR